MLAMDRTYYRTSVHPQEVEMKLKRTLPDGTPVSLVCLEPTRKRLYQHHFRPVRTPAASHFKTWRSVPDVITQDSSVSRDLLEDIGNAYAESGEGVYSVTLTHSESVGWETSAPLITFQPDELETFWLRPNASALRVRQATGKHKAPETRHVTIVYEIMRDRERSGGLFVLLHDLYPGIDLGELKGNITEREKRVFYRFDHPGV